MAEEFDDIEELARRFLIIQANYLAASNRPPASDTSRAVEASPAEHKSDAAVNGGRVWDGHASPDVPGIDARFSRRIAALGRTKPPTVHFAVNRLSARSGTRHAVHINCAVLARTRFSQPLPRRAASGIRLEMATLAVEAPPPEPNVTKEMLPPVEPNPEPLKSAMPDTAFVERKFARLEPGSPELAAARPRAPARPSSPMKLPAARRIPVRLPPRTAAPEAGAVKPEEPAAKVEEPEPAAAVAPSLAEATAPEPQTALTPPIAPHPAPALPEAELLIRFPAELIEFDDEPQDTVRLAEPGPEEAPKGPEPPQATVVVETAPTPAPEPSAMPRPRQATPAALEAFEQQDYAAAYAAWHTDAVAGNSEAQYRLGLLYARGQGVAPNIADAYSWYRRAADQDHAEAQYQLSLLHQFGREDVNVFGTGEWYRVAAGHDKSATERNLALFFPNGLSVERDDAAALRWGLAAAGQALPEAQALVGGYYS